MQRIDPLARAIHLLAFEVHAYSRQPRRRIEPAPRARPPAVDTEVGQRFVERPITTDLPVGRPFAIRRSCRWQSSGGTRIIHGAGQSLSFQHHMKNHSKMIRVELLDGAGRLWKCTRIPRELSVVGIPAIGTETGAQINQRGAGEPLLAEN